MAASPETSWRYRVLRQPTFDYFWHFHPEYELVLIVRGTGTRIVGDSIETYVAGALTLIGPGIAHAYVSTMDTTGQEAIIIQFARDFLGSAFFDRPELAAVARLLDAAATTFAPSQEVVQQLPQLADLDPPERTLALLRLLIALSRDERARALAGGRHLDRLSAAARQRLQAACTYLQASFAGDAPLADVPRWHT